MVEPAELRDLQRAIRTDVSARGGLKNIGRAISDQLAGDGLETRHPDHFLRSFRVTEVEDREGFGRGNFGMNGVTRNGDRTLLFFDGEVLFKPPSFEHHDLRARPLAVKERSDLLRALDKAAVAPLPNRSMRAGAKRVRDAVAAEHKAARGSRRARAPRSK